MPPTIVLVHGTFGESASWDRVIEPLQTAGHRVIAGRLARRLRRPPAGDG
jgi:pimeloyl-ACP methyl ester carboxylesterase